MYLRIQNENYGYSVATRGKWVAVGNPSFNFYPTEQVGIPTSGSVDVYLYNKHTDQHDLVDTLYRHLWPDEEILLAAENENILHTEPTGSVPRTRDLDIAIDYGLYLTSSQDDYGRSLDIHGELLGVGYTRSSMSFVFVSESIDFSGSGGVDLYDLGIYDPDSVLIKDPITFSNQFTASGFYYYAVNVPPGYSAISLEMSANSTDWTTIETLSTDYEVGGQYVFHFSTGSSGSYYRVVESADTDPYILTIPNPHPAISQSFGFSLSINDDWIAVGSPYYSSSKGAVYMFRKYGGPSYENLSWSFHSIITLSNGQVGDLFGWSLELNDAPGFIGYDTSSVAYSQSLVVGTGKSSGSVVYYFEISGSGGLSGSIDSAVWNQLYSLSPIYTNYPLTYYPQAYPLLSSSWVGPSPVADRFGFDVSIYGDTIVIGAPYDRYYYEYTQSAVYQQGAFYIFKRCPDPEQGFYLKMKSHGNEKSLKNHRLGYAVDVYDDNLVVGCPRVTAQSPDIVDTGSAGSGLDPCYVQGSLLQAHYCSNEQEFQIHGQYCYLQYNTSSTNWEYANVYQIKKRQYSPYRNFGFAVDVSDRFITVGSPMNLSGSQRIIDLYTTGSDWQDYDPIAGQAYIYNLDNYRAEFHVGNVFYRNGKLVIISSGSQFDGLFMSPIADVDYQYSLYFQNKHTLHEKQVLCSVEPGEFNVSTNPTAITVPTASFDINRNGRFDFQDLDILLMYMRWKSTEDSVYETTDWSSSLLADDSEVSWHNYLKYSGSFYGTEALYSSSFATLNTTTMFNQLDFNQDSRIDTNDQNILWKYFTNRLTQKNFDKYITVNSVRRLYGDILDHLNERTGRTKVPQIKSEFLDYARLSQNDITGSYLAPFVTTIGLYQDGELVSVAKLGSPIKLLPDYPYNFVVKMDF